MKIFQVLSLLLFPISLAIPRNSKLWIFGNKKGYIDSSKYFFEYCSSVNKDVDCIWLASSAYEAETINEMGFRSVQRESFAGIFYSILGGYQFICNGFGDINRPLAIGSKVINFWHGTPIKKIYIDSSYDLDRLGRNWISRKIAKFLMIGLNSRIFRYYASNSIERDIVCNAANISTSRSRIFGSPRFDEIRRKMDGSSNRHDALQGSKVILFAPTWREGKVWHPGFALSNEEQVRLSRLLEEKNWVLLIKPHPLTDRQEVEKWQFSDVSRCYISADLGLNDINGIYPMADALITDISSAVFDFLIMNRPVLFFMPDAEAYTSGDRGIYPYYQKFIENNYRRDWNSLIESLEDLNLDKHHQSTELLSFLQKEISTHKEVCATIYNDLITNP